MATYAGYNAGAGISGIPTGILGGITATLGIVCPAIVVICIISKFMQKFKDNKYVKSAFYGLRPASIGLILAALFGVVNIALINLGANSVASFFNVKGIILALCLFLLQKFFKKIHPIALIAIAAVVGIIFKF
jgi:chromate transporter